MLQKPLETEEQKNSILLPCICETEFVEFNRVEYDDDLTETYVTVYHCNLNIKMTFVQKLYACWSVLRNGRALLYDVILKDKDLRELKTWLDRQNI